MANYTILLIDYEPRSIERFRQPLTAAGYAVEVATDGLAGVEAFERLRPDMVLVEAMIPKKHGFEVCQEIKRSQNGRRTPVLITTGVYKGRKYRTQALHIYGCDEYIEKPIASEQLLAIVGRFLAAGGGGRTVAAPPRANEAETDDRGDRSPAPSPAGRASSAPRRGGPSAPTSATPAAIVRDLTEDEITARLDAILPTGEASIPAFPSPAPVAEPIAAVAEAEPIAEPETETEPAEIDPFQQMQAELNAELGSLSASLDLSPAPVLEPGPEPAAPSLPSDDAPAPSLLESLDRGDDEIESETMEPALPPTPSQEAEPAPEPPPGRVVGVDANRGRETKGPGDVEEDDGGRGSARPREAGGGREFAIPSGSLVASVLEGQTAKRGFPIWIAVAAVVALIVAAYLVFLRGGVLGFTVANVPALVQNAAPAAAGDDAGGSNPASAAETAAVPDASAPSQPVTEAPPAETRPARETPSAASHPPEARAAGNARPERATPAEPPTARASEPPRAPAHSRPEPQPAARAPAAPAQAESAPAAPTTVLGGVAAGGVAAILPPPEGASVPTVAAGALVPMSEVDAPPVSLTRKVPAYSMQARQMRVQGTVVLRVLVDENGSVADVQVITPVLGADVTESAVNAAKQWTYRPATKDGVPVKVWKIESVAFKL